jgi:hypothetical protein
MQADPTGRTQEHDIRSSFAPRNEKRGQQTKAAGRVAGPPDSQADEHEEAAAEFGQDDEAQGAADRRRAS